MGVYVIVQKLLQRAEGLIQNNWLLIIASAIICILLAGAGGYYAGHSSGRAESERDANIERVQRINEQLEQAREGVDSATRTNNEARSVVTNGIVINERIEQSLDRGQSANARTSESIAEAQRLIDESKQGFSESQRIISDSKSILERARTRAKKGTEERQTE